MKKEIESKFADRNPINVDVLITAENEIISGNRMRNSPDAMNNLLPEILFITSYPPRECGIATYSQDLINALNNKFSNSFLIKICALEPKDETYTYSDKVNYILDTSNPKEYQGLAYQINQRKTVKIVIIQHEFGFFRPFGEDAFLQFLHILTKPVILVFHTVLPHPNETLKVMVGKMVTVCESVVVMTDNSKGVLINDYDISLQKISVIAHGTHLVSNIKRKSLKKKYGYIGNKILSTFGLLSSGKSIETTLEALPSIIKTTPEVIFLVIGITHPGVIKSEGEKYRRMLEDKVVSLNLSQHVRFINKYLNLPDLLEYLQLTDIYLFTSKDPNQAVSGTFSYAMSCACPIISTPIPQAREMLNNDTGIIIDFQNSQQLAEGVIRLLQNESLRKNISTNTLHKIAPTAWENSAIAHALLFKNISGGEISLRYTPPVISLRHIKQLTTHFGMIQFSKINHPDIGSGYTLDDNARALIAMCMHYELTNEKTDLEYIYVYLKFIKYCMQPDGYLLNYVNKDEEFTRQNDENNLEDANGRAIWALGYLISKKALLPEEMSKIAEELMQNIILCAGNMHSSRAMAFTIKGLYYYNRKTQSTTNLVLLETLANRLAAMYKHESEENWDWFESYLTYANSILPEAMLCAYLVTKNINYKSIAKKSFDFLLSQTFGKNSIKVISNKSWLSKGEEPGDYGEQPIDVSYTILALRLFYKIYKEEDYLRKLKLAFNWFLGNNHLHQIIYNPCTGGCYDGLEEKQINLNQGAESTISYLMARLTIEKYSPLYMTNKQQLSIPNYTLENT